MIMALNDLLAAVAQVQQFKDGQLVGYGSSFWYHHGNGLFLITNRHVVINEKDDLSPDELRLLLHTDNKRLTKNDVLRVRLYENKRQIWREHPIHRAP